MNGQHTAYEEAAGGGAYEEGEHIDDVRDENYGEVYYTCVCGVKKCGNQCVE